MRTALAFPVAGTVRRRLIALGIDPYDAASLLRRQTVGTPLYHADCGAIAQLGERLLCKQEVTGSIPVGSTHEGPANNAFLPVRRCLSRRMRSDEPR